MFFCHEYVPYCTLLHVLSGYSFHYILGHDLFELTCFFMSGMLSCLVFYPLGYLEPHWIFSSFHSICFPYRDDIMRD